MAFGRKQVVTNRLLKKPNEQLFQMHGIASFFNSYHYEFDGFGNHAALKGSYGHMIRIKRN